MKNQLIIQCLVQGLLVKLICKWGRGNHKFKNQLYQSMIRWWMISLWAILQQFKMIAILALFKIMVRVKWVMKYG